MATNLRFETSSTSPDGAQFISGIANGHRSMDRSSSFRDNHDSRGGCAEQVPLTQLLALDIPLGEQKYARPLELRRVMDDPAQVRSLENLGPEELKRVKHNISENSSRTRELQRHMSEAISRLDKYRSSVQSKKRSKPDTTSARGPGQSPPDRVLTKAAGQPDSVKPQEKGKIVNKRLRTSITGGAQDVTRPNSTVKKSSDRESPRSSSVLPSPTEDKARVPGEGWEKNKLKGRRSAIKPDPNITSSGNGVLEGERDHKWSGQHRLSQEARTRLNETHGLRSGPVHGVTSIHKAEASLPMNGSVAQRNVSKVDELIVTEKGDRFPGMDKERLPKNGLKPPLQEDSHLIAGSSTVTKGKASRTSRPSVQFHLNRVSTLTEKPQTAKAQVPTGQGNRKRPASRSSSPVAQWGGQRAHKIARGGRRIPPGGPLPSSEDNSLLDPIPDRETSATTGVRFANSNGVPGVARRLSTGNVHLSAQSKARTERSVVVSESEESEEASESKVKDKGKKQGEWEPRPVSTHKGNLLLSVKATQSGSKEDGGDGVRRQGRSGRNFCPKPVPPAMDKLDGSTSNAKQLRSARTEKPDRPGRTPSRKVTADRKSLSRMRRPADIGLLMSPGESDDDHEELLNAVRTATDASAAACPNDFWKEMEPYFTFLTDNDLSYLRQLAESSATTDALQKQCANGLVEAEVLADRSDVRSGVRGGGGGGWYDRIYPLSQRLLAALINEDDEGDGCLVGATSLHDQKLFLDGSFAQNGHGNYSPALEDATDADDILLEAAGRGQLTKADGLCTNRSTSPLESQYQSMSFDERIALELQSIGILVDDVPDLSRDEDELCTEISKLQDELKDQVIINRQRVATLERSILARRETEIRERERLAVSKLVEIAYSRRKGCRGVPKSSNKASSRAAYVMFSKRALARVRKFEDGHSCFTDPGLRDVLLCRSTKANESNAAANSADTSVTPGVSETSIPKSGKLVLKRSEGNADPPRAKDASSAWKDRDEEVTGATSVRNTVSFNGAKGKRSERERDGKGQGKESHRKNESDRLQKQGVGTVKGERRTKTKPRAKAAPLFKDVNGLGKPAEVPKETPVVVAPPSLPLEDETGLELGGLGDDLGTWLDSMVPADAQGGELTSGLAVPMDNLDDLGMMV